MENNIVPINNPLGNITRIEYHGQPVLTTSQIAEYYECEDYRIKQNFSNNKDRFVEGKHYFKLECEDLDLLRVKNFYLQISPKTRVLYLWTKRGCARHCKSIGTDVAWDVFEVLEDAYFNQVVDRDKPLESISDFQRGKALSKLAQAAQDPYTKKRLVAKAANLILGEEFIPVPERVTPVVQMTLFK